ncbi:hypothetical protein STENM36S_00935 [Streptomyces tendae]
MPSGQTSQGEGNARRPWAEARQNDGPIGHAHPPPGRPWSSCAPGPAVPARAAPGHGASVAAHRVKISAYRAGSDWCIMCDASGTDS